VESTEPLSISLKTFIDFLVLIFLLFLSGVFSGSETALTSIGRLKLKEMLDKSDNPNKRQIIHDALHKPNWLLTTILVCNNLVNILASSIATVIALDLLPKRAEGIAVAIVTGIMTFAILVFGEITPKIYAKENTEKVFKRTIQFINFLGVILGPVVFVLMKISNLFIKMFGGEKLDEAPFITEDEIIFAVEVGKKEGILKKEESEFVSRILEMKDTDVREIMVPRVDMVCVEDEDNLLELIKLIKEEGFSRIPVYHETIDNIIGICYAKDIINILAEESDLRNIEKIKVRELMHQPYFIPETKKISDLLSEFRKMKIHMAIVVDEFGGTLGLATLEDILEYIVGEIMDEFDHDEKLGIKQIKENVYIIDAKTPIADLERELNIEFPETEFETIGGYLLEVFEKVPSVGEEIDVNGFNFKILAASKSRIDKIQMEIKHKLKQEDLSIESEE
jgi:CBS domain containing-hemolysin-like protein